MHPIARTSAAGTRPAYAPANGTHRSVHRRRAPWIALLLLGPLVASCKGLPSGGGDMSTSQAVIDIGNMVVQLREENADLQAQIDSLRSAAAYQDSIVRQLAAVAGVAVRPSGSSLP